MNQLATTATPPCPALDILPSIMAWHHRVSRFITPVYAYDGRAPPIKVNTEKKRIELHKRNGAKWLELCESTQQESNFLSNAETLKGATEARMKMSRGSL
eukprot:CCRYP_020620-RA/>CCRYP_020620-RA protein AED:0.24 eAED:0.24 QI:0/-1/0/1/-1/1/1/0/99